MKTIFKVLINKERTACGCKCNATHYEDVLAMILSFIYWIKQGDEQDDVFFDEIEKALNDWNLEHKEQKKVENFINLLRNFIRGRLNEKLVFTNFDNIQKDNSIETIPLVEGYLDYLEKWGTNDCYITKTHLLQIHNELLKKVGDSHA